MKRILVCEDEDAIRDFVVINLVRSGYDVVDVSCGEDAVKVYTEQNGNFDVALLDIMMPGMDGFALCRWIREQSSEIGIIMLSAKSQEMDKVNCLMIGADDYVTKPFSPSELVARVDAIYRRVNVTQARQDTVKNIISGPFTLDYQSRTTPRKLAGLTKYGNITLKWGVVGSLEMMEWLHTVASDNTSGPTGIERKTITIKLLDDTGAEGPSWEIINAWPTHYTAPDLNGLGGEVAIETLEICHEGVNRIDGGSMDSATPSEN